MQVTNACMHETNISQSEEIVHTDSVVYNSRMQRKISDQYIFAYFDFQKYILTAI